MAKKVTVVDIDNKLNKILKNQKLILEQEKKSLKEEKQIEHTEESELEELKKLELLEKQIKHEVEPHPLLKITSKDIAKGTVGAFIGVLAHYTFIYGIEVAHEISMFRAALLFPAAFALGGIFLYMAGFRQVRDPKVLRFLPVRLIVMYVIAIIMASVVLLFFNPEFGHNFQESFKQLATVMLLGLIGAVTADLVGH